MDLIDERGRLFGRVNVVDALVVLLVVAVVAAGLALVLGGGGGTPPASGPSTNESAEPSDTTVATLEFGTHPPHVADLVRVENVTVDGHDASVTDVAVEPRGESDHILVRVAFEGNRTDRGFVVGEDTDDPLVLRYGTSVSVRAPDYQLTAGIQTVGDSPTFDARSTNESDAPEDTTHATVDLGTQPRAVARLVTTGNVAASGHEATITDVYRTPTGGDRVRVLARMSFAGNRTDRGFVVGEETDDVVTLRYATTLDLTTPEYRLGGQVLTIRDDPAFETRERRVVLNVSTTEPVATAMSAGDTERIAGAPVATVERAERTARDNDTTYVEVTLTVRALSTDGPDEYAGAPIRLGRTIPFETDRYAVRGTVIEVGS